MKTRRRLLTFSLYEVAHANQEEYIPCIRLQVGERGVDRGRHMIEGVHHQSPESVEQNRRSS